MTKMHPTPMLDHLEGRLAELRDWVQAPGENPMMVDLLGQLEHSYENRKGYWKGGTVSVYGYGVG